MAAAACQARLPESTDSARTDDALESHRVSTAPHCRILHSTTIESSVQIQVQYVSTRTLLPVNVHCICTI